MKYLGSHVKLWEEARMFYFLVSLQKFDCQMEYAKNRFLHYITPAYLLFKI